MEGDKEAKKNEKEKDEKKISWREEKEESNIKDEASRSKNVICGRCKKRCLGFATNADKLDDSTDRKLSRIQEMGKNYYIW